MISNKITLPFLIIVALLSTSVNAQVIYEVGDSLTTNPNDEYPCPYGNELDDSRHQMLFRASELIAAGMSEGDITSFAMWVLIPNNEELFDYEIQMGTTTDSVLTLQYQTGLTTVWGGLDYTNQIGWNTHSFVSPFYWDGVSNLVVQTCNNNTQNSDNPIMVHTTTSWTSTIWQLTNTGNICGGGGGAQPSDSSFDRPVVRFGLIPAFAPPVSNFTPQNISTCSNTVQFQDLSAFDPVSWLWNFGDNTTDTTQNPAHTYSADGVYDITLITYNAFGSDTLVVTNGITINASGPQPISACIPNTTSVLAGFGILSIDFANTAVNSGDGSTENFADRSCNLDTVLTGTTMNINIGTGTAAGHNVRVWIDWDNSGTFAASELMLTANSVNSASASFTVPSNAVLNTPLRIRAVADYELSPLPTPCGNPQYGQAEDYGLVVQLNSQPPVSDFASDASVTCTGQVQFNDLSLNSPTVWQWDFGDTNTSQMQNPLHTYAADGIYTVTLIAFNAFGSDTLVFTNYITVSLGSQLSTALCIPQTQTVLGDYGITSFDLSTISSTSPGAIEGYQDRSCEFNTTLQEGISVPISIGTGIQNAHDVFIWLDLNNDGTFTSNELIWSALSVNNPSGSISIPSGSVYNTPLRLRVTADAIGNITGGCDAPAFGQTEDFGLTITQNLNPPTALFNANSSSICAGDAVQFNDLSVNLPTTWSWDFGDSGTSMMQNPTHTYNTPGTYNVTLSVTNSNGSDAVTQTGFITVLDSLACDTSELNFFNSPLTLNSCGGVVVDDGGANGNYSQFGQGLVSIQPSGGDVVLLSFAQFDIRNQDDFIVYDGPDDTSPIIGTYNGTALPNGGLIVSSGAAISFELDVAGGGGGGGGFGDGFIVNWQCSFLSVEEFDALNLLVFPNPATDMLNIVASESLQGASSFSLINALGQLVMSEQINLAAGRTELNISALRAGSYVLRIRNEKGTHTSHLVIK